MNSRLKSIFDLIWSERITITLSILVCVLIVETFFTVQVIFVLDTFKLKMLIVPTVLGTLIGILTSAIFILRSKLNKQKDLFMAIADQSSDFSFYRKPSGEFIYISPSAEALTGYKPEDFYNNSGLLSNLIHPEDQAMWKEHVHYVDSSQTHEPVIFRITDRNGDLKWINHICSSVYDEQNKLIGVRSTNVDITSEEINKRKIEHMAFYDPLTDLPNRRFLEKHIKQLIKESAISANHFAILFVDLNRFKYINDTYGHGFGDKFLHLVSERLKKHCHKNTFLSRFGGDEFVVTTPNIDEPQSATQIATNIINLLEMPIEIENKSLYVSASIGISVYPFDGQDADTLIKHADAAMYQSKKEGHSNIGFASSRLVNDANRILTLESKLRHSIQNDEFHLYYQPKINISNNTLIGFEALARWKPHDSDIILPDEFIPLADETGLIIPISNLLIKQLFNQFTLWKQSGNCHKVAVNFSSHQLQSQEYCRDFIEKLSREQIPTEYIEVEITEGLLMDDLQQAKKQIEFLSEHGITISIDDFGTGYSSLKYLKHLPIQCLKIDQSFISSLCLSNKDLAITKTIITLANNLGMDVIAEGVETPEQAKQLLELGCYKAQGYLFGAPQPPELIATETLYRL